MADNARDKVLKAKDEGEEAEAKSVTAAVGGKTRAEVQQMDTAALIQWLRDEKRVVEFGDDQVQVLEKHKIHGTRFLELTEAALVSVGIPLSVALDLVKMIKSFSPGAYMLLHTDHEHDARHTHDTPTWRLVARPDSCTLDASHIDTQTHGVCRGHIVCVCVMSCESTHPSPTLISQCTSPSIPPPIHPPSSLPNTIPLDTSGIGAQGARGADVAGVALACLHPFHAGGVVEMTAAPQRPQLFGPSTRERGTASEMARRTEDLLRPHSWSHHLVASAVVKCFVGLYCVASARGVAF
mmetsp:Transcript_9673/g.20656  ORF Transcript_9673/g.20656 Transcript_9673/m.20656 type:complete len:296 (+) Transcript_9673:596-1483(+)